MAPRKVGPYEVIQLLTSGGMAEVYLARKTGPGGFEKRIVLKRIAKELLGDRQIESMFIDEARVQALLDHPNIVQIYDFGEDGGSYYIAMELVVGATLRWVIDNATAVRRPLPLHHALRIASDVLSGLHHAHERVAENGQPLGLIHRDISPVNIMIARNGTAKLCDFGVAKSQLQRARTQTGIVKGKYRYMSPEQLSGEPLDQRADVFAVGVCLWEMLVGRRLFDHDTEDDAALAIRAGDYAAPSEYRSGLPRAVDRILRQALQPDPARRFRSARELHLACEEVLRLLPKTSNSVLLGEYISAELDGIAGLMPDRQRRPAADASGVATGFEMLDPPIPTSPTQVVAVEAESLYDDDAIAMLPPPSALGRAASLALLIPAGAFAGIARAAEAFGSLVRRGRGRYGDDIQVTRLTSRK